MFLIHISPLYISFVSYNQIIVPQSLDLTIATGREGVPFPTVVELILMTIGITVIREASLRIPGSVGYFVGAIAAVVIGQATVSAGYVSASSLSSSLFLKYHPLLYQQLQWSIHQGLLIIFLLYWLVFLECLA